MLCPRLSACWCVFASHLSFHFNWIEIFWEFDLLSLNDVQKNRKHLKHKTRFEASETIQQTTWKLSMADHFRMKELLTKLQDAKKWMLNIFGNRFANHSKWSLDQSQNKHARQQQQKTRLRYSAYIFRRRIRSLNDVHVQCTLFRHDIHFFEITHQNYIVKECLTCLKYGNRIEKYTHKSYTILVRQDETETNKKSQPTTKSTFSFCALAVSSRWVFHL